MVAVGCVTAAPSIAAGSAGASTLTASARTTRTAVRKHHLQQAMVGTGTARVKHAGAITQVLRASQRDRRRLGRSHHVPLTISLHIGALRATVHGTLR